MHRYIALIVTLVLLTSNSSLAQSGGMSEPLSRLSVNLMKIAEVPGLSIATIEDGKIAGLGPLGVKDANTTERVDAQTVFPAASLGKAVFAYGVLKLVDEGKLDLDVPLSRYVPAYELAIKYYPKSLELDPGNPTAVENLKKLGAK